MTGMGRESAIAVLAIAMTAMAGTATAGEGSGKGTIGIVCIDPSGKHHYWDTKNPEEFGSCIDDVVDEWASRNSSGSGDGSSNSATGDSDESTDELIRGFDTYRRSMYRARAAMTPATPAAKETQ